ncbi:lysogenization protein HflD [Wohlfahrtiimonas larvae]|uniref:High frequency lysogenization protein HflD homolog n=1 Tax=Wohlfahrtiimonas larvae TaxID=1157986 RepID=A0ABP9MVS0_9GAMM|nr:DUF489 family protein [Wohlfahrtiimonas larvae]
MTNDLRGQTIALAGVMQSAILVDRLAKQQQYSEAAAHGLVYSIFETDPQNIESVYDGLSNLKVGFQALGNPRNLPKDAMVYFTNMLKLQKRLREHSSYLNIMGSGIENVKGRLVHFPMMHDNIQMALADLYTQTISKLSPRIYVKGDPSVAMTESHAAKIRTLLLAGVRSGILWHQAGGTTWNRIMQYHKIMAEASRLTYEIE